MPGSRICVKNVPKYVSEDRLREYFSQKGEVTDAKLARTSDGKSRQFGFIGYRTEREAEEAIKYFNKSYLDTSRITCEIAYKVGDPNIPRPWSRHSLKEESKTTISDKKVSETKGFTGLGKEKKNLGEDSDVKNPQLQEFLEVMQPRVKSKSWANDTVITPAADKNGKVREKQTPTITKTVEPAPVHTQSDKDCETVEYGSPDGRATNNSQTITPDDISDMDYFKSRLKKNWSNSDSSDGGGNDDDDDDDDGTSSIDESPKEQDVQGVLNRQSNTSEEDASGNFQGKHGSEENSTGEVLDQDEKGVLETSRLFVRNLPYSTTEEELEEVFGKCGTVSQVHLDIDKDTKRSKGIAYVLYTHSEFAARALEELDNSVFQGRLLHVMLAKQKESSKKLETDAVASRGPKTFKQQKEEERKAKEAGGDTRAWNAMFMRPDTVAENVARKYGVSKTDFLNTEADDLGVRIALGETQVIAETKKAFKNAGVNVESLENFAAGGTDGSKRSNHILLVKNLPYGSSDGELAKMFGKFGNLDKIILPPTKTLALVVFLEPGDARAAIKGLAYKRYKDAPLYVEWAPANVLSQTSTTEGNEKSGVVGEKDAKRVILEQHLEETLEGDADPDRVQSRSLFVKNLNFRTSSETLQKHFVQHIKEGTVLSVKVAMHKKHGKDVSRGYGFVEFDSMETAIHVCKEMQGTVLDGHALILQLCQTKKGEQAPKKSESDKSSTKLLVRNIAFAAVEKDLRQLFSPFGQIKSLRLPMKMFGGHKGFAFVEYVTKQEAQKALQALSSTHLYGRRLVLERAKEGETLEELRARTAAQFVDEENGFQNPTKLSKKRKSMAVLDERNMKFERLAD